MLTIRDQAAAERWLEAGTALRRTIPVFEASMVGAFLTATIGEIEGLPPPGVVLDIAALLLGGRIDPNAPTPPDEALAHAVAAYEHQVLGRIASDPRITIAADAVMRLPKDLRPTAVGVTLATMLTRLKPKHLVSAAPGAARRFAQRATESPDPFAAVRDDVQTCAVLTDGYTGLCEAAQRTRSLLGEGDVFTLEHLAVLESLAQRIALSDVIAARALLMEGIPKRMRRKVRQRGTTSSAAEEEDTYPIGGFSSLSTNGSFENLVTSELVYLEEGDDVDMFDIRFAQGELLYYTRDEAQLLRTHRLLTVLFDAGLGEARSKDPGVHVQRIVLVFALLHALIVRVVDELGHEDLRIRIAIPPTFAAEVALVEVLFLEQIERGVVEVVRNWTAKEEVDRVNFAAGRGLAQLIQCGSGQWTEVDAGTALRGAPTVYSVDRKVEVFQIPTTTPTTVVDEQARLMRLLHDVI